MYVNTLEISSKLDSHLAKKIFFFCFNDSPSKKMNNVFLFHLKRSFCSQDIYIFIKIYDVTTWFMNN